MNEPTLRWLARWAISILLISIPASYLFWQWRFEEHDLLEKLSYDAFNKHLASTSTPVYWTFALWAVVWITAILIASATLAWGLGRVFRPSHPQS